jgi:hypothetical protein
MQGSLNAACQDLFRLARVGDSPRELEGSHHEAEDGHRAAAARCGTGVRKQCGQRRNVTSQPFLIGLPGGQGLAGNFREQRRRGAPPAGSSRWARFRYLRIAAGAPTGGPCATSQNGGQRLFTAARFKARSADGARGEFRLPYWEENIDIGDYSGCLCATIQLR